MLAKRLYTQWGKSSCVRCQQCMPTLLLLHTYSPPTFLLRCLAALLANTSNSKKFILGFGIAKGHRIMTAFMSPGKQSKITTKGYLGEIFPLCTIQSIN